LQQLSARTSSFTARITEDTDAFPLDELHGNSFEIVRSDSDRTHKTVVLRWLESEKPNIPSSVLPRGWKEVTMSIEDIFVAMILQQH